MKSNTNFVEYNNRAKANKYAEYITGEELRKYVARKVEQYAGQNVSVFDGAAGSGQLEQFIQPSSFVAVEIQAESCEALKGNYPQAVVFNESFFTYPTACQCDCVVMNPPFSLKFKDLSEEEQQGIQADFPWKKSGVVDDIFTLKGLANANRWGFFILFPGVAYRGTEKQFRSLIGNQLVELNRIQNAFEDTPIDVLFLVVDKLKTDSNAKRELYDCKAKQLINSDEWTINPDHWEQVQPPVRAEEKVNPIELEAFARESVKKKIIAELRFSKMVTMFERTPEAEFDVFCDEICELVQAEKFSNGASTFDLDSMVGALR
ncbi:N-6 DNA methylase [Actinobacillus pleuropneumoniae]|uniref:Type I restriction enzyme M protein n=2 Tax=Actinobacillus pleuropneumoniae TaxID=715 RepID=B3H0X0_ACTP7|nr:N-6 DNA methylase [Actinobacillus pleuropneumoniae]ACE61132.1 Type I restriction enzyme M protein [Actinobacillus pleuropneumoniae serovar 7 str. AP76]UKH38590.1 SAM-dependent methyltransferase [Actinobacillus pleuropneumoniae]VEJ16399.1 type I restriction enzyme EcoR124II M protein [Actinobacillus pleuropneumoniae]